MDEGIALFIDVLSLLMFFSYVSFYIKLLYKMDFK